MKLPSAVVSGAAWFERFAGAANNPAYHAYMRDEWGYEKRGDVPLFEKLCLEGAQAGLSWATILAKREGYRAAFHEFDLERCAAMSDGAIDALLQQPEARVIRHIGKLRAVRTNAQCVLALIAEREAEGRVRPPHGFFDELVWSFVGGAPRLNAWADAASIPSRSEQGDALSKELKRRGFSFVGPTTCYSLMQSCGLVVDHPKGSPEWRAASERLAVGAGEDEGAAAKPPKRRRVK